MIGVLLVLFQLITLRREVIWLRKAINTIQQGQSLEDQGLYNRRFPRLLASLAAFLRESQKENRYLELSATSLGAIVSVVANRVDEGQETNRYLSALLILVGLLGTFWGLMNTIEGITFAVANMQFDSGINAQLFFDNLRSRLQAPLAGMGVAFSSSLFGLAGSLIIGFLGLQNGQAHNRFINELEDWLTSLTRLTHQESQGQSNVPVGGSNDIASNLDRLVRAIQMMENNRRVLDHNLNELIARLGSVAEDTGSSKRIWQRLEQMNDQIVPLIAQTNQNLNTLVTAEAIGQLEQTLKAIPEQIARGRHDNLEQLSLQVQRLCEQLHEQSARLQKQEPLTPHLNEMLGYLSSISAQIEDSKQAMLEQSYRNAQASYNNPEQEQ